MDKYILESMKYFTVEEWTKMDGSEQLKYGRIIYIYYACTHLGIEIVPPQFMCQQKTVQEKLQMEETTIINKCKYCEVTFILKTDNDKHKKTCSKRFDITQKKRYDCDACDYSSDRSRNLKLHKLMHTKEKQFVCNFCQRVFCRKADLTRHIKLIHSTQHVKSNTKKTHILKENDKRDKRNRRIRKRCTICYNKLATEKGAVQATILAKKVRTFCDTCINKPFICINCFPNHIM